MKTPNDAQKALDRFAAAAENGKLQRSLKELLDDEPFSRFEEWAESLTAIFEAVEGARTALEEWEEAEDRDSKADAKERALEALDELVSACNDSPLEVTELSDWVMPED